MSPRPARPHPARLPDAGLADAGLPEGRLPEGRLPDAVALRADAAPGSGLALAEGVAALGLRPRLGVRGQDGRRPACAPVAATAPARTAAVIAEPADPADPGGTRLGRARPGRAPHPRAAGDIAGNRPARPRRHRDRAAGFAGFAKAARPGGRDGAGARGTSRQGAAARQAGARACRGGSAPRRHRRAGPPPAAQRGGGSRRERAGPIPPRGDRPGVVTIPPAILHFRTGGSPLGPGPVPAMQRLAAGGSSREARGSECPRARRRRRTRSG